MRYVPSTAVGSLMMGAVRQAARETGADPELARTVIENTLTCLEVHESGNTGFGVFQTANCEMSDAFLAWAKALEQGDQAAAAAARAKLDALAQDHPFDYYQTRQIYEAHYRHVGYQASLKNYRPWDGSDPDFAVVEARLPADARVAILGDWGTGEEDANALVRDMLEKTPDVILHLGDVYDAGLPLEMEEHFLKPIADACADLGVARPPIFTIPGNHEYYSGAVGFFQLIDVLNQQIGQNGEWAQKASFFCLRSEDDRWQFLGADTGLQCTQHKLRDAPGIEPAELQWHKDRIDEFKDKGQTVFLTHHQLLSADLHLCDEPGDARYTNPQLVNAMAEYFEHVDLWLWGHDHWFIPYGPGASIPRPGHPSPVLRLGQLMGGSARETTEGKHVHGHLLGNWVPRDPDNPGQSLQPALGNPAYPGGKPIYNHTYAILELETGQITHYQVPAWTDQSPAPVKKKAANDVVMRQMIPFRLRPAGSQG